MPPFSARQVRDQARALGFNLVGITAAAPSPHLSAYLDWIANGMQGEMDYLARPDRMERRRDLNVILPGVRSLVIVGLDYHNLPLPPALSADPARGRIAAYAWGRDYHAVMLARLEQLAGQLAGAGASVKHRVYVDTGALLERDHAQQAGLGFIGKNTMLIHPRRGSDFFLGEILTDVDCDEYDQPGPATRCGTCTRCLTACPTHAFPRPYVLDARRCISYLTIEHHDWIDRELRPLMGNWVFGCDICQDVCPWQRFAIRTQAAEFIPADPDRAAPPLARLLALDEPAFEQRFRGTPLERAGRDRLVRNACVAAGNSRVRDLAPQLANLLRDGIPLIRGHAAWALGRLLGRESAPLLQTQLFAEEEVRVREEIRAALDHLIPGD